MADCLFCKLISNPKPGFLVHDDPDVVAFRDISPQAPTHLLIVPRQHFPDLTAMESHTGLIGKMFGVALDLAKREKLDAGFRTVINVKEQGGQTVFHVHLHLMGGGRLAGKLA